MGQSCASGLVTANDAGAPDTGPNDLMNFPIITSAYYDAVETTISGTLDTMHPATSTVDVYTSDGPDGSGYGEARVYLGSTAAPGGSWTLVFSGPSPYLYLSATAIRAPPATPLGPGAPVSGPFGLPPCRGIPAGLWRNVHTQTCHQNAA